MRETLFRGKTDKGEWVQGDLYHRNEEVLINNFHEGFNLGVIPETIGQYTGLMCNGKKIFEGDIVKVTDDNGETNLCSCGIGEVCFYDGVWYIDDEVNDGLYDVNKIYYVEVIGNIHDNPELLKEMKDNENR